MYYGYSHDESWRKSRLKKAFQIFCRIYGITEDQAELLVQSLHDQKGHLFVQWVDLCAPTDEQKRAFAIAWETCGEAGNMVQHTHDVI